MTTGTDPARRQVSSFPQFDAVIFDMDGVVTDTAALHATAWRTLFDAVFADPRVPDGADRRPFDSGADYRKYVDGRSREDGVSSFLASRGFGLPPGRSEDGPDAWTVKGVAARKNALYLQEVTARGVRAFPGTVELLHRLKADGVPMGLVTASRNAVATLDAVGLGGMFSVVVDGNTAARLGLPGKPDPAMFLQAARELGVKPGRAAVIEDAVSGVQAARTGGFGLVVGIARNRRREELEIAGAHLVLDDAGELDMGSLRTNPWVLVYEGFDPFHEGHREALTTVGNGYLATRGAAPEQGADGAHYPGTYLAGVYNRLTSRVEGVEVEHESLVNAPNWLYLDLRLDGGQWWSEGGLLPGDERRELDLRHGVLTRTVVLAVPAGGALLVHQRRFVSMEQPHLAAMATTISSRGVTGRIDVRTGMDAGVRNNNVAEYSKLAAHHLRLVSAENRDGATTLVEAQTTGSHIRIGVAARTVITAAFPPLSIEETSSHGLVLRRSQLPITDGAHVTVDTEVAFATSRDAAVTSARDGALRALMRAPAGFEALLAGHRTAWDLLWNRFAIELDTDVQTRLILNLHVFHLLQTLSPHTATIDAGVPARGLHGEGYRGHVFWDELFVLPLLTMRLPAVSRSLLDYRWRRLEAARYTARQAGLGGALFPWQSGSDGREETPRQLFNPRSRRWMADHSRRQYHVGLAVAYNSWQYYQATGDMEWLAAHGAELIIEVARLFTSLAVHDRADDRFHLNGVMGPDEYHDGYPDAPGQGLRDNAYTNVLAAWVCRQAAETLTILAGHNLEDLTERLRISPAEVRQWVRLSESLYVPFNADGTISQFDGYDGLTELNWESYRSKYGNIGRLDLILEAEDDSTNHYKLSKQADVLMLFYLFGPDGLGAELSRLGYAVGSEALERTVDFYLARTSNGSTLSRVVHASVLARMDRAGSWDTFKDALVEDLDDTQGGTTKEGIHLGAMAGTVDVVLRAYAGLQIRPEALTFTPRLPDGLRAASFKVLYRGHLMSISIDHQELRVTTEPCSAATVLIRVGGQEAALGGGEMKVFPLQNGRGHPQPASDARTH